MRGWDARGSNTSPGAWGFRAPERNSHKLLCFLGELGWLHPMVDARYPEVAAQLVVQLEGHPATPCLGAATAAARVLMGIMNFEPPSWRSVLLGARPPHHHTDTFKPGTQRQGWQHEVSSRIEEHFKVALLDWLPDSAKASLRSQGGPGRGGTVLHHVPHLFGDTF